jgi:MFS transporter, SP family, solute carrier family 2 (facilitated glucose transporter), member 3
LNKLISFRLTRIPYLQVGELNIPQRVMSCDDATPEISRLPPCIKMTLNQFSIVTSVFNLGGIFGSLFLSKWADSKGRRWTMLASTGLLGIGALVMGFASTISGLIIGRIIVGIGSGVVSLG